MFGIVCDRKLVAVQMSHFVAEHIDRIENERKDRSFLILQQMTDS
jgi:hypothetical protein